MEKEKINKYREKTREVRKPSERREKITVSKFLLL